MIDTSSKRSAMSIHPPERYDRLGHDVEQEPFVLRRQPFAFTPP
jgi:hypothetical protein